jgi:hypothetical protein
MQVWFPMNTYRKYGRLINFFSNLEIIFTFFVAEFQE